MSGTLPSSPAIEQALARACAFVEARGGVLARERLDALMGAARPGRIEAALAAWRQSDGGFARLSEPPPLLSGRGTLGGALGALGVLEEAGLRRGPLVEGVVAWLAPAQGDDGAWRAGPEEKLLPEDSNALFLTGMLAGHLSKLPCGSPRTLERAEAYLAACFSPEQVEDGDWRTLTAYTHVCANGASELADEALQWCGRALEKGWRGGRLDALAAARLLLLGDVRALPGGRVEAGEVGLALLQQQNADGSFGRAGAPAERVEETLLGVRALTRFTRTGAPWIPA